MKPGSAGGMRRAARNERGATGTALRRSHVGIVEPDAARSERIQIGRSNILISQDADITRAVIVANQDQNVGPRIGRLLRRAADSKKKRECNQNCGSHTFFLTRRSQSSTLYEILCLNHLIKMEHQLRRICRYTYIRRCANGIS